MTTPNNHTDVPTEDLDQSVNNDDVQETDATDQDTDTDRTPVDNQDENVVNNKIAKANKEAAKYRNQLREKESELEHVRTEFEQREALLTEQLKTAQWDILKSHQLASGRTVHLSAEQMQQFGHKITDFLDKQGNLDHQKYRAAVTKQAEDVGILSRTVPSAGTGGETIEDPNDFARKLAGDQYQD